MLRIEPEKIIKGIEAKKIRNIDDAIAVYYSLDRVINLGDIEPGIGSMVDSLIRLWNEMDDYDKIPIEKRQPIKIRIDSPGGELNDAFTIIDSIRLSKTPIHMFNIGAAYSAGLIIFIAGNKRFCYPHSSFLLHEGSAGAGGTANQFEGFAQFYKRQLQQMKEHILERTLMTEEEYEKIRKDDHWMDAEEALKLGFVDEIINYT